MFAAFLGACAVDAPDDTHFPAQQFDADVPPSVVGSLDRSDATVLPDLEGVWLLHSEISTCVSIIAVEELLQRSIYLVETRQPSPPLVSETFIACEILLSPILGLDSTITPALLATSYPVDVEDGVASGAAVGAGYTSGPVVELWGLDMDDPLREPFPTQTDDPRIVDLDQDDQPGTTLPVGGGSCDTYLAQRSITRLQGSVVAPDEIAGELFSSTEQLVVGATRSLCATRYETTSNYTRNQFRRIRVDGRGGAIDLDLDGDGVITCQEVLPAAAELFVRTEIDHSTCQHGE